MNDTINDAIRLNAPRIGPEGYEEIWDKLDGQHYDRRGNSISMREWSMLRQMGRGREDYVIVKQEYVGSYWISTVWLGLDHGWGGGKPLIFETMVFNHSMPEAVMPPYPTEKGVLSPAEFREWMDSDEMQEWMRTRPEQTSSTDLECERYSTEEEAIEGHQRMVEKVRLIVEASRYAEGA